MKAILIDVSKSYVGVIIGEHSILKILNFRLRKKFGKTVHMKELRLSEKFSVLRIFNQLLSESGVELYSLRLKNDNFWAEIVRAAVQRKISTLYVDLEVGEQLKRRVHSSFLKVLNIYASKEDVQYADILAYGDSHHDLVRNIWKDVSIKRGDTQIE